MNLRSSLQWKSKKLEDVNPCGIWKIELTWEQQQGRVQNWTLALKVAIGERHRFRPGCQAASPAAWRWEKPGPTWGLKWRPHYVKYCMIGMIMGSKWMRRRGIKTKERWGVERTRLKAPSLPGTVSIRDQGARQERHPSENEMREFTVKFGF